MTPAEWEALAKALQPLAPSLVAGLVGGWLAHRLTLRREFTRRRETRRDTAKLLLANWGHLQQSLRRIFEGSTDTPLPLGVWKASEAHIIESFGKHAEAVLRLYFELTDLEDRRRARAAADAAVSGGEALANLVVGGPPDLVDEDEQEGIGRLMSGANVALEEAAK